MNRWILTAGLAAACSPSAPLSVSLEPGAVPMLSALPADATVIIGGEPEAVLAMARQADLLPIEPGELTAEAMVGACNQDGCAAILEGRLARAPELARFSQRKTRALPDGVELIAEDGLAMQVRWSGAHLHIGHARAVEALQEVATLDPATLQGAIPAGDLWVFARDQDLLFEQVSTWLTDRGTREAAEALAELEAELDRRPALADEIRTIALSLTAEGDPAVRLRLQCTDETSARAILLALKGVGVLNQQRHPDPRVGDALSRATYTRHGTTVEAVLIDTDGLALSMLTERER